MDASRLREDFARLTAAGLPEFAGFPTKDGETREIVGTVLALRADVAASMYGSGEAYKASFLTGYADPLPGKDDILRLRGRDWVVIGVEVISTVSARIDLREGF